MTAASIRRGFAITLVVALMGVAGCGEDEEPAAEESTPEATATETPAAAEAEGESLALAASEEGGLSFDPKSLTAKAGTVTVTMENPEGNSQPHNVALEGEGVDEAGEVVQAGQTSTATADVVAGEYTFYCAVGSHRQAGMEGTLTVE